jgi:hypothetical protein
VANAGGAFALKPSATAPMHCDASGGVAPYTFAWTIPVNGGTAVSLSGYTGADTTLNAPSSPAQVGVQCKVTDSAGSTAQAIVNVSVATSGTSGMTASAGPTFSVKSGTTAPLQCSTMGANGSVQYDWSIIDNGGQPVQLTVSSGALTSFIAPTVTASTTITAQCVATDSTLATASAVVDVTVLPNGAPSVLTAYAGADYSVQGGGVAPLHCDASGGTGPYAFQWVIKDSGGLPISLSGYNLADTSFTAPAATASTPVQLECRATDNVGAIATSTVTATVASSGTSATTLVARLKNASTVTPGQVVQLDTTGTGWYNSSGVSTNGPVVNYAWTTTASGVSFSDNAGVAPTFVVPTTITTVTNIPVTVTVTSGGQTSSATTVYTVDPNGVIKLSVTPPASTGSVSNPQAFQFAANAQYTGAARNLYYQWTQVSGPTTSIGGDSTATMGVSPTATGTYVFRLAVGYQPIDALNPGLYFTDVVLQMTP